MKTIKQECNSCGGTGLYSGFCEAKDTAVVCLSCEGRGWNTHSYSEFTHRKRRRGIQSIQMSRGSFIATGVGGAGAVMSYKEFEQKFKVESAK